MNTLLSTYSLAVLPACALVAGVVTAFSSRNQPPDEGSLWRDFSLTVCLLSVMAYGVTSTSTYRNRFDPVTMARNQLLAQPSFAALQKHQPELWALAERNIEALGASGLKAPDIAAQIEAQQVAIVRARLDTAIGASDYAREMLPALIELRDSRPQVCLEAVWSRLRVSPPLTASVSPLAAERFRRGVAQVMEKHTTTGTRPSVPFLIQGGDLLNPQSPARAALIALQERHGDAVITLLKGDLKTLDPTLACGMSIELIEGMLTLEPMWADPVLWAVLN
jgi:hypothetical protein